MPICRRSGNSARVAAAWPALLAAVLGVPASAQTPAPQTGTAPANAREGAAAEGGAALDRLKSATEQRKADPQQRGLCCKNREA